MGEFGVNWTSKDFTSGFFELFGFVAEGNDLGGADKGKVKRVEEKNNVLSFIVVDVDFTEVSIEPSGGWKLRGRFSDQGHIFLIIIFLELSTLINSDQDFS